MDNSTGLRFPNVTQRIAARRIASRSIDQLEALIELDNRTDAGVLTQAQHNAIWAALEALRTVEVV